MTDAISKRNSTFHKRLALLLVVTGGALLSVAGALSVGTVVIDVDARYRVETFPVEVNLCQQGLTLTIR